MFHLSYGNSILFLSCLLCIDIRNTILLLRSKSKTTVLHYRSQPKYFYLDQQSMIMYALVNVYLLYRTTIYFIVFITLQIQYSYFFYKQELFQSRQIERPYRTPPSSNKQSSATQKCCGVVFFFFFCIIFVLYTFFFKLKYSFFCVLNILSLITASTEM